VNETSINQNKNPTSTIAMVIPPCDTYTDQWLNFTTTEQQGVFSEETGDKEKDELWRLRVEFILTLPLCARE
jgi:hypothetical protein